MSRWGYRSLKIVAAVAHFDGEIITLLVVCHCCRYSICSNLEKGDVERCKWAQRGMTPVGFHVNTNECE